MKEIAITIVHAPEDHGITLTYHQLTRKACLDPKRIVEQPGAGRMASGVTLGLRRGIRKMPLLTADW